MKIKKSIPKDSRLRKTLTLILFVIWLCSGAFPQTQDSIYHSSLDSLSSLSKKDSLEGICVDHAGRFVESDLFQRTMAENFSLTNEITSQDIDHSTAESVGDLLETWSLINVAKVGPWGQPEIGNIGGIARGINIFMDGNPWQQQDLYFPQRGESDLNSISLSSISKIEFLPAGMSNILANGTGMMGINIVTKDFDGDQPYSKIGADRGPYSFHKEIVELGRGISSWGKFYLTSELKKSDGYLTNSDYDGFSFSGKTTFNLKRRMDLKLSAYQYKTTMGLPLFPDASFQDARKKVNNWGINGTFLFQENIHALLNVDLQYGKQNHEIKSKAYNFESRKIDEMVSLTTTQTFERERSKVRIEGGARRNNLSRLTLNHAVLGGSISITDLYQLRPTTLLVLSSRLDKEEGLDAGVSVYGGVSYKPLKDVNIFWTLGRSVGYPTLLDRFWLPFSVNFKDTMVDYMEEGNNSLRSQRSFATDLGTVIKRKSFKIGAYVFGSKINDLIFWSNVDTTIYYGHLKPINSEAKIWGANINLNLSFLNYVTSSVSYSFKQGRESKRKNMLPFTPEHSLFGYFQYENEFLKREINLRLRLETNVLSLRYLDEYEKDKEPEVTILNGKIAIRFLDFHFYYLVHNITDQIYKLSGDYYMPERSYWWGFYWEFFD